jgi:hypothetical protein
VADLGRIYAVMSGVGFGASVMDRDAPLALVFFALIVFAVFGKARSTKEPG